MVFKEYLINFYSVQQNKGANQSLINFNGKPIYIFHVIVSEVFFFHIVLLNTNYF